MKGLTIFTNENFGCIRTTKDDSGEPLFCLNDICKVLELRAPDVKRRLDDDVVSNHTVKDSKGRKNLMIFVNEDGLYDVIFDSRKPEARSFRKWVTGEVLPQIRRTGGYIPVKESDSEEDLLARTMEIMGRTLDEKNRLIESLRPKAEYYDETLRSVSTFPVRVIAHTLQMTAQELNRFLCEHGVQYGQSGSYVPYAPYARQGFTRSRTFNRHLEDGTVETQHRTSWTEAGVCFIVNLVKEERRKVLPKVHVVQLTFQF